MHECHTRRSRQLLIALKVYLDNFQTAFSTMGHHAKQLQQRKRERNNAFFDRKTTDGKVERDKNKISAIDPFDPTGAAFCLSIYEESIKNDSRRHGALKPWQEEEEPHRTREGETKSKSQDMMTCGTCGKQFSKSALSRCVVCMTHGCPECFPKAFHVYIRGGVRYRQSCVDVHDKSKNRVSEATKICAESEKGRELTSKVDDGTTTDDTDETDNDTIDEEKIHEESSEDDIPPFQRDLSFLHTLEKASIKLGFFLDDAILNCCSAYSAK